MRAALALFAACLLVGCGGARDQAAGVSNANADNPGFIVFGGVPDPSGRHPPIGHYALRPDGTGLRKLAFSPDEGDLGFSADGRFASVSVPSSGRESLIVVSRPNGSERRVVPLPKGSYAFSPSLSPDGQSVALALTRDLDTGHFELWTVSVDGRGLERLSSTGDVLSTAWSPDGSRIAFVDGSALADSSDGAVGDVYVVRTDGSDLRRIVRAFTGIGGVAWSPDGKRLAFEDEAQRISIVDADGGKADVVAPDGQAPAWSPDGKRLAFLRVSSCGSYGACSRAKILLADVSSGAIREVGPKFGGAVSLSWTTATLEPGAEGSKSPVPPSS